MKSKINSDQELEDLYKACKAMTAPTPVEARQRGYQFESILEYLLRGMDGEASFRIPGEQIDGSFFLWGQTFLLEAKWQKLKIEASEVYSFKGKLDGKFHTTSGVFVSMSGYSPDTNNALRFGKEINILLFDGGDMDAIIEGGVAFTEVLKYKLRQAGNIGEPYVPYQLKKDAKEISLQMPVISGAAASYIYKADTGVDVGKPGDPLFLVMSDRLSGDGVAESLFKNIKLNRPVAFQFKEVKISSHSIKTINSLSYQLGSLSEKYDFKGVIVLLNTDSKGQEIRLSIEKPLKEILEKNSIELSVAVFNIDFAGLQERFFQPVKFYTGVSGVPELKEYLNEIIEDEHLFYDDISARKAVKRALESAEWDKNNKEIIFPDDFDSRRSVTIKSLGELLAHLEEIALNAGSEETPLEILKDDEERPDYSELVGRVLRDYDIQLNEMGFF